MIETQKTGYLRNDSLSDKLLRNIRTNKIYLYNTVRRLDLTGPKVREELIGREELADYIEISSDEAKETNTGLEVQLGAFMKETYKHNYSAFFRDFTLPEGIVLEMKV